MLQGNKSFAPQLPEAALLGARDQADVAGAGNDAGGYRAAFHIAALQLDEMHSNMAKMRKHLSVLSSLRDVKSEVHTYSELQALLPCCPGKTTNKVILWRICAKD